MNFKKYHVSRNLFDVSTVEKGRIDNGEVGYVSQTSSLTIEGGTVSFTTTATYRGVCSGFFEIPNGTETITFNFIRNEALGVKFVFYDSAKTWLNQDYTPTLTDIPPATANIPTGAKYVRLSFTGQIVGGYSYTMSDIMLNTGNTVLPYEPYGNSWHDTPHYIHTTSTDTLTTLPAVVYPNATTATVGLKGQAVQSATPTPQNPVMPQGTGERTGNLLPEFYATSGEISGNSYTITKNSIETHNDGSVLGAYYVLTEFRRYANYANYAIIDEKHSFKIPAGTYTFSGNENIHSGNNGLRLIVGELGQTVAGATEGAKNIGIGQTFTINEDSYVCPVLEIRYDSQVDEYILTNPMLNTGSTALPYKPYGFEISISSASITTPIYLGEVETTRKIWKLVLTGEENWGGGKLDSVWRYYIRLSNSMNVGLCTHYKWDRTSGGTEDHFYLTDTRYLYIFSSNLSTVADFKAYLAAQYAAGTPVCVWYVLAESETGIVNEPLMRIGDYADTLSNVSIPVTAGGDTISVDTTVQPSEVTVNYKGWHPVADVHEKSKNLFDKDNTTPVSLYYQEQREIIATNQYVVSIIIPVSPNTTYTFNNSTGNRNRICETETIPEMNDTVINYISSDDNASITLTTSNDTHYILWWVGYQQAYSDIADTLSVNLGSEALPYEPYWK